MAAKTDVLKMLEAQKQHARMDVSHPDEIKKEWIGAITDFYKKIRGWLRDAETKKLIVVEEGEVRLHEKILHIYTAPSLGLTTPRGQVIEIIPRARFIVGAAGRIDITFGTRSLMAIRTDAGNWEFVEPEPAGGWKRELVTEDSFWQGIGGFIAGHGE